MSRIAERFPHANLPHVDLGTAPTPVRRLDELDAGVEVWGKDEGQFGDGRWGGQPATRTRVGGPSVRKLEWIIPEAQRRGFSTLFTVGGIGTDWGLAAALYGREHGLRTVLGLVDRPVDDHVLDRLRRIEASGATIHRYPSARRLRRATPWLLMRHTSGGRMPYYLPAGGSSPVGALGYVETALEIAAQVADGSMPEPATIVTAVGSGGTAAGLALGLRIAGLRTRVLGVVGHDSVRLDAVTISRLANQTAALLRTRGAAVTVNITPDDLAAVCGLRLEPVCTAKALAAIRSMGARLDGPVLFLQTHGPRPETVSRFPNPRS